MRRIWEKAQDDEYRSANEIDEDIGDCNLEGYSDINGLLHIYYMGMHYITDLMEPEFNIRRSR